MAFNIPVFPVQQSPYKDLVKDALESFGKTRYGLPREAADLEIAKLQPESMRTQMQLQKAQAAKANAIMGLISQYLGGGSSNSNSQASPMFASSGSSSSSTQPQPQQENPENFGGNGNDTSSNISNLLNDDKDISSMNTSAPPAIGQSASPNNKDLARESFISHLLGFGSTQLIDVNGTKMALTGTGKLFPVAQGLDPYHEGLQKGLGKYAAQSYGESVNSVKGIQNQNVALDEMINQIDKNPEFYNVTGPVQSFFTKWAGNPAQQKLLGSLQTASGEIALQVAPSLKGAFTGRDQTLINTIKANPNTDFPYIFVGKLKAQKLINSVLEQRESLAGEYIKKGVDPLQARKLAAKQTPLEKYRPIVEKLLDPMVTIQNEKGDRKQIRFSEAQKLMRKK